MTGRTSDLDAMSPAERLVHMKQLRVSAMRKMAASLQIWRHCGQGACRRAGGCADPDPGRCVGIGMRAMFSEEDKAVLKFALEARLANVPIDMIIKQAEALSARLQAEKEQREREEAPTAWQAPPPAPPRSKRARTPAPPPPPETQASRAAATRWAREAESAPGRGLSLWRS